MLMMPSQPPVANVPYLPTPWAKVHTKVFHAREMLVCPVAYRLWVRDVRP